MNRTSKISKTDPRDSGEADGHPAIEVLDAYHQGDLSPKEAAQVQHHLIFCRECRDLLLDLARFLEGSQAASRLWSAELTSAWEEWQAELGRRTSEKT
jgi:anti-sigma factor ChrR (cupin superfamily)